MKFAFLAPLALTAALAGCSPSQIQSVTTSLTQLNAATIQLTASTIQNTQALAQQLATVICPIANGAVMLGNAIEASNGVAQNVKNFLAQVGPTVTTVASICNAAGFTTTTAAAALPMGVAAAPVPALSHRSRMKLRKLMARRIVIR